jgi:hypothetical protein
MNLNLKQKAIRLRKKGWSYTTISEQLKVSKSTLSHWLAQIPYKPNEETTKRIKDGPAKSAFLSHEKKLQAIKTAKLQAAAELKNLSQRDLWMLGLGLYIGEGSKIHEYTRIVNSDPNVIKLAIKWFRDVCRIPTENFFLTVHLYPNVSAIEAINFWSKIAGVPVTQFGQTQIDKRLNKTAKKQRVLPFGTLHISIRSCGHPEFGVLLHRRIMGWVEEIYKQTRGRRIVVIPQVSNLMPGVRFPSPAPIKTQAKLF